MPIIASAKNTALELPPAGTFIARCYSLMDIGTHETEWQGHKKRVRKIRLGFELPEERRADGEPFTISRELVNSLHVKATLRKTLESWRGRPFTAEELDHFDLAALLGAPALINIAHAERKDGTGKYASVTNVTRPMKGQVCPPAINSPIEYSIDQGRNFLFQNFPDWLREKIEKCLEWKLPMPGQIQTPAADAPAENAEDENGPF